MAILNKQTRTIDKSIERLIRKDGEEFAWCNFHEDYHPVEQFGKNKNSNTGLDYRCKKTRSLTRPKKDPSAVTWADTQNLLCQEILKDLGYNTQGDKPVWKQFEERHQEKFR